MEYEIISEETLMKQMGGSLWLNVPEGKKCKLCGNIFRPQQKRKCGHHRALHLGKVKVKPFQCSECDCSFKNQNKLDKHTKDHERNRQIGLDVVRDPNIRHCSLCQKVFGSSALFQEHRRTHPEMNKFHCYECKERFYYQHELNKHYKTTNHAEDPETPYTPPEATKPVKVKYADKAPSLHPVMVLQQLAQQKIDYITSTAKDENDILYHQVHANIKGKDFTGKSTNVKKAKFNLAKDAIFTLFGIESTYQLPA